MKLIDGVVDGLALFFSFSSLTTASFEGYIIVPERTTVFPVIVGPLSSAVRLPRGTRLHTGNSLHCPPGSDTQDLPKQPTRS